MLLLCVWEIRNISTLLVDLGIQEIYPERQRLHAIQDKNWVVLEERLY